MMNDERFDNDAGRIRARLMANKKYKNINKAEREEINNYFNVFQMYCENDVIDRLKRLRKKLVDKNLMFKFDGGFYAIFSLSIEDRTQITDYTLSLEQVEEFAESV